MAEVTTEVELLKQFLDIVCEQGKRKAKLYDGIQGTRDFDRIFRFLVEEIGEVASAIERERYELAKVECIDVAHCAFLVYMALDRKLEKKELEERLGRSDNSKLER